MNTCDKMHFILYASNSMGTLKRNYKYDNEFNDRLMTSQFTTLFYQNTKSTYYKRNNNDQTFVTTLNLLLIIQTKLFIISVPKSIK